MLVQDSVDWNGNIIKSVVLNNKDVDYSDLIRFYSDKLKKMVIDESKKDQKEVGA